MTVVMRVSVAMCTYNGARFLPAQLESLASQTLVPDELVVVDDGSTDDTESLVREFAGRVPFAVHFHANPQRLGVTRNFEKAMRLCSGDIIFPADQDDVWDKNKIALMLGPFANTSVQKVGS